MKTKEELRVGIYRKYYFAKNLPISLISFIVVDLLFNFIIGIYSQKNNTVDWNIFMIVWGFMIGFFYSFIRAATINVRVRMKTLWDEIDKKQVEIKKIEVTIGNFPKNYNQEDLKKLMKITKIEEKILKLSLEYDMISE